MADRAGPFPVGSWVRIRTDSGSSVEGVGIVVSVDPEHNWSHLIDALITVEDPPEFAMYPCAEFELIAIAPDDPLVARWLEERIAQ